MTLTTKVSVVVPTYRRPDVLAGCLNALTAQRHMPSEIVVCRRTTDSATAEFLATLPETGPVRDLVVGPDDNFAAALNAGIMASRGDLVALTDDDAEAPEDWVERLVASFDAPEVAGVGGRDIIAGAEPKAPIVGKVQWYGRVIGNHHIGVGPPRDVDVLKGVNCCFRGDLIRKVGVDPRLHGTGTVIHTEMSLCLPLRRAGYRLIYDPSINLIHHAAPRGDGDKTHRGGFNAKALEDIVHNETLQLMDHLSLPGRLGFLAWSATVGKASAPALLQTLRTLPEYGPRLSFARLRATTNGRIGGLVTALSTKRPDASAHGMK